MHPSIDKLSFWTLYHSHSGILSKKPKVLLICICLAVSHSYLFYNSVLFLYQSIEMVSCLFVIFHWVCSYHLSLLRTFFGSCLSSDEIVIFSMLTPLADGISTWCYLFLSLSKVKQTPLSQTDSLLMLLPSLHPRVLAIDTHALCLKFSDATLQSPMYLMLGIIRFLKCPSCPCFPHSYFSSCSSVSAPVFLLCLAQQLLGLHKFCFSTSWSVGFGGPALWLVVSLAAYDKMSSHNHAAYCTEAQAFHFFPVLWDVIDI